MGGSSHMGPAWGHIAKKFGFSSSVNSRQRICHKPYASMDMLGLQTISSINRVHKKITHTNSQKPF